MESNRRRLASLLILAAGLVGGTARAATCTPDATTLCLGGGRFQVRVDWQALNLHPPTGGQGQATMLTPDTGHFTFFSASNVELVVKVLDARGLPGNYFWVFYGALSNVQYALTVTDTQTGAFQRYFNPQSDQASFADTQAFKDDFPGGPEANFAVSTPTPAAGSVVQFNDSSTGSPTKWTWDFGDHTPFDQRQNPTHIFASPGTYNVTLTVRDGVSSGDQTIPITIGITPG
jgi:PKD repeat protein